MEAFIYDILTCIYFSYWAHIPPKAHNSVNPMNHIVFTSEIYKATEVKTWLLFNKVWPWITIEATLYTF